MDVYSEDQTTPRASLASLVSAAQAYGQVPRDDTAFSTLARAGDASSEVQHVNPTDLSLRQEQQPRTSLPEDRVPHFGNQRRSSRRGFRFTGSSNHAAGDYPEIPLGQAKHSTQSLGRRFSRNYKQTIHELRESVSKHATLPGRMRRSSTPFEADSQGSEHYLDPAVLHPSSPSTKRTATKPADFRAKKSRLFALSGGLTGTSSGQENRKDTPAPPGFNGPRLPPQSQILADCVNAGWQPHGGGSARAAAAAYNQPPPFNDATWHLQSEYDEVQQQREQRARRATFCSNGDAADSGADLSTGQVSPSKEDSVADVDDMELDQRLDELEQEPPRADPAAALPSELCLQIFHYLEAQDLLQATQVSQAWRTLASEASVWREAYMRKYGRRVYTDPAPVQVGGAGVGRTGKRDQEWKKIYKARLELDQNWRMGAQRAGKAIYLSGHTDSVYCVQFDEEKIITGSRDRTIRVWDINTFQCLRVIGGPSVRPVLGPKVLRTVDYPAFHLATASVNGTAYGDNIYHTPSQWHNASILCLQYDDEILVTGSSDSDLIVWDIKTYEPITRLSKHTGGVLDVALDAKHIVSCSKDSRIIVWDRKTFKPIGELAGHRGPVNAVQLRGKYLVSASGDGIARLWDLQEMKLVKQFEAKERGLAAVEFSEDMKYVLAGGNDHITYKFDVETGKEVLQFTGHTQLVRSLWLDSANDRVVSGSYDLDLRVYDFVTGQEIWRAEEWTTSWMLAAKSDYRRIVATSQDGRILVVDFGLNKSRGPEDGQPIENVDLLRGIEHTNAIQWRNPWTS